MSLKWSRACAAAEKNKLDVRDGCWRTGKQEHRVVMYRPLDHPIPAKAKRIRFTGRDEGVTARHTMRIHPLTGITNFPSPARSR